MISSTFYYFILLLDVVLELFPHTVDADGIRTRHFHDWHTRRMSPCLEINESQEHSFQTKPIPKMPFNFVAVLLEESLYAVHT